MVTVKPIRRLIPFLLAMLLFSSCRVMLVPQYSEELDNEISATAKATDKLYLDMLDVAANERLYETFKDRYNDIESEINSIQLKNEARPKNGDFLAIIKNLKDAFAEAKKYHKDHQVLSDGEALEYQATLAGFWKPLYIAEHSLK